MKILVSGSHGLIGSSLLPFLGDCGHHIFYLVREKKEKGDNSIIWDPLRRKVNREVLENIDVFIHLAGENIFSNRWTPQKKKEIYDSRILTTKFLCGEIRKLTRLPKVFICASSIRCYGDCGDKLIDEKRAFGKSFFCKVCADWEKASSSLKKSGIRVVNLRFGSILSRDGGLLFRMQVPFRMGLGGRIGSGEQYVSWISLEDVVGIIYHTIFHKELYGPVNVASPNPVKNKEFAKTLGRVLRRPSAFVLPESIAHFIFGEMADELMLASVRANPVKLLKSEYEFKHPSLEEALKDLLLL